MDKNDLVDMGILELISILKTETNVFVRDAIESELIRKTNLAIRISNDGMIEVVSGNLVLSETKIGDHFLL